MLALSSSTWTGQIRSVELPTQEGNCVMVMDCLRKCYCTKTPQDLSGDTIMLTFQFSLMFLIASRGSVLMYSTGDLNG